MIATDTCPHPRAQRLKSRLAAVLVVGGLAGGLAFGGASSASAAVDDDAVATAELHVAVGTTGQIAADGPLDASVRVTNTSDETLDAGTLTVELGREPLTDSTAIDQWLDEGLSSVEFDPVVTAPTDELAGGDAAQVETSAASEDLDTLDPGIYPVRASLDVTAATGAPAPDVVPATTVVIVPDGALPRTAVLVPITATPLDGSLLTATELTTLTADDGALTAQLDALSGTSAILAVDPAIVASIRMLGNAAPESATAWLDRLETLPNERFLLQFADADAAVQAHSGQRTLLTPGGLQPLLDPADFTSATPTPTPTPTPDAAATDDPMLPDDDELTALRDARTDVLWPQADVTADDLTTFAGYLGDDVTTILPSSSTDGGDAAPAGAMAGEHAVLVTADAASDRLSAAVQEGDETARNRELAATVAHLSLTDGEGPVLLGLDRSEARVGTSLRTALSALSAPAIALDDLAGTTPASISVTAKADGARSASLGTLLDDEQRLVSFSTILDEPRVLLTPERIRILRLIGVGLPAEEFTAGVLEHRSNTVDTLNAVGIQQPSAIQLFTAAAPLPVWIRNDLPWPVNVALATQPTDARLDVQPTTQVEALAASNTRVTVPVEARVASGDLRVDFRLYSPTGVPIGQVQSADVTVRADWETIGLGILGGIIVLLLAFGIIRTVRRRRRDAAASDASDDDSGGSAADATEGATEEAPESPAEPAESTERAE